MEDNAPVKPSPFDKIADFVALCNTASAAIAPPIAILGITVLFLKWISDAVLDNTPKAKRVLIAYTVDLLLVLEELFNMTLPIESPAISLPIMQLAFQAYDSQRMGDKVVRDLVHQTVRHLVESHGRLDTDLAVESVKGLLQQYGVI
ncbi:hypothetical protein FB451DRAFT_1277952 [Mycena latifolia]|nr:hypothetical protein FB451DRAFT_1277952 [Mycena latifolia]